MNLRSSFARFTLPLAAGFFPALWVQADDDISNEFRQTVTFHHPIKGELTGSGQIEYRENPDKKYDAYGVLWPSVTYSAMPRLQLTAGLLSLYTDNHAGADKLELRPFAGAKYFIRNSRKWNIYNYTRYEYRDTENRETGAWAAYGRVRSRFGVEVPFTSHASAWKPNTWYGLADVEPVYRFDHNTIDPVYARAGFGYILHNRARLEFVYWADFARNSSGALKLAQNIIQVDFKIGLSEGILDRIRNPHVDK